MPQALRLVSFHLRAALGTALTEPYGCNRGELPVDAGRREARERADQEQGQPVKFIALTS